MHLHSKAEVIVVSKSYIDVPTVVCLLLRLTIYKNERA